ncbi:MAG: glucose-1-phosphate adenylyltransferase family protein [Candidatus Sumerlaeaceae bacterium]|jgi:glucose-1-phosphate adenylyltransferase
MTVVAMLLAGGQGSRLSILSQHRAKPAVPFGGSYRIIDFTLSNVMHAEIPYIGILTQYKPYSLMEHFGNGEWWGFAGRGRVGRILPPATGEEDSDWYAGTADAVWQNRNFLARFSPELVLVLSGDHIYQMDYADLIAFHRERKAELTIAMQRVPWEDTSRFGVALTDERGRIVQFQEKPKSNPISNLASLGIYVFDTDVLLRRLAEDAENNQSKHDFGMNVIPSMLDRDRVYAYEFSGYWRDVGTIQSYWDANMESLDPRSGLDLVEWRVRTNYYDPRPQNELPARIGPQARISNSYVPRGCVVEGVVEHSILFPGVHVERDAVVRDSIVMNNSYIAQGCAIERAILDKNVRVEQCCRIGTSETSIPNKDFPHLLDSGLVVVGKNSHLPAGMEIGKNVLICPDVEPQDFTSGKLDSGMTVYPSKKQHRGALTG